MRIRVRYLLFPATAFKAVCRTVSDLYTEIIDSGTQTYLMDVLSTGKSATTLPASTKFDASRTGTDGDSMTDETVIDPADLLESVPTVVTVDGDRFVLSTCESGDPVLYSAVCPHQRGRVKVVNEATLRCPNHRWEFDASSGNRLSGGGGHC